MRTSAAFSTLGWFDDPLLSHLMRYDKTILRESVFHELFHNTLYVKGAGAFNESSANFVGHVASSDFFRAKYGDGSAEYLDAVQAWQEEREFGAFIAEMARTLGYLYSRDIAHATSCACVKKCLRAARPNGCAVSPTGRGIGFAPLASARSTMRC